VPNRRRTVPISSRTGLAWRPTVCPEEAAVEFVQLIEMRTKRFEELQSLENEWLTSTEGKRTLRRSLVGRDRDDPEHYYILAFFDDFDSAMANSNLPETGEFGAKQQALCDAPVAFTNLDVVEEH
jgi:hypothetical protein